MATAPLAAAGLIAGFAAAVATGSRPLGGVVLAAFGLSCIAVWLRRDGRRTAALLTVVGLAAFAVSHVLGLVIGAWPAVLVVAAVTAVVCWRVSDSHRPNAAVDPSAPAGAGRSPRPGVRPAAAAGSPRTPLRSDRRGPSA
ncbi:MAG: hypothetical protein ACR2MK_01420 [Solirubrobacteraceae bacterium]